jgi:nicotinamidase-related amidase
MIRNSALLIIDVQAGAFESPLIPPIYRASELLKTIHELISRARRTEVEIIYVQHNGTAGHPLESATEPWRIHPDISPAECDVVVQKWHSDSFHQTSLQEVMESRNIGTLMVVGLQTEYCVDTTCRRAFSLGYEVVLVKDGHSTWDTESLTAQQIINHHNRTLGNGFATVTAADDISFGKSPAHKVRQETRM